MTVIGIDPSMSGTGIATEILGTVDAHTVMGLLGDMRLVAIHHAITTAVNATEATLAVIEDLPANAKSAGITGMAQGVVRLALLDAHVPFVSVPPATLKKYATGRGNATKADMRMAWFQRTGQDVRDDNQVDALWLWHMGAEWQANPLFQLPANQRDALTKVGWPT